MKDLAYTVATIFLDHGEVIFLGVFLGGITDIAEMVAGFHLLDTLVEGFLAYGGESAGEYAGLADQECFARIAVKTIFNDGDVNINNITLF